jgi:hypothetical protein
MSKNIKVEFEAAVPENTTDEQIQEWLEFNLIGGKIKIAKFFAMMEPN